MNDAPDKAPLPTDDVEIEIIRKDGKEFPSPVVIKCIGCKNVVDIKSPGQNCPICGYDRGWGK